jgi:hypothetical protein
VARPYWTRSTYRYPLTVDPDPVPANQVMQWADRQAAAATLDLAAGRGWALSAANLDNGDSIASIVVSHAITDGQGSLAAVDLAARADLSHTVPDHQRPTLRDDLVDATTGGARAYLRTVLLTALLRARATRDLLMPKRLASGTDRRAEIAGPPPAVAVAISTDQLRDIAAAHGGTTTGLITAIAANVVHSVHHYRARTLRLALPVSVRESGDPTAGNKVASAEYELDLLEGARYTDLGEIRRRSKAAYAAAVTPSGPSRRGLDVLISNVGLMSPHAIDAAGSTRAVAARAVMSQFPGAARDGKEPIMVFAVHSPETIYLTFQPTPAWRTPLASHLDRELQHWTITPRPTWS